MSKPETLRDVINGPGVCVNCADKGKVVVRVHNEDKLIDCPVCKQQRIKLNEGDDSR